MSAERELSFFCPSCHSQNRLDGSTPHCQGCGASLMDDSQVYCLVNSDLVEHEREFYDSEYSDLSKRHQEPATVASLEDRWHQADQPELKIVRESVGSTRDKAILLIGNGGSEKELSFLLGNPWRLVYSDLSRFACHAVMNRVDLSAYDECLRFAALDAQKLPFPENSFDLVYGFGMVHHLPDINTFLKEASRVLRPGGHAVFFDDAYSPIWHWSKQTWLKPLMKHSHNKTGISPEDYRFSMTGGFKENDLEPLLTDLKVKPWFKRTSFLTYIFFRGVEKLFPKRISKALRKPFPAGLITSLDRLIGLLPIFKKNQIRLIWGFEKV
jgi:ubiquinone/menaquinone biosynthesis C-methylase UbiE